MTKILRFNGSYVPLNSVSFFGIRMELGFINPMEKKYNLIFRTTDGTTHTLVSGAESMEILEEFLEKEIFCDECMYIEYKETKDLIKESNTRKEKKQNKTEETLIKLKGIEEVKTDIEVISVDIPIPKTKEEEEAVLAKADEILKEKESKSKTRKTKKEG